MNASLPTAPRRILVVDDQQDVRQLLKTALECEGFVVDVAFDARDALRCLKDAHYDLVLTDYAMPGGTGTWLLLEAERQGLLSGTPAIVITAHPDIQGLTDFPVLEKPLDIDQLLEQVRTLTHAPAPPPPQPTAGVPAVRARLVLYVSGGSPACGRALRNLRQVLAGFDSPQVELTVHDLSKEPLSGDEEHIVFTPTLVKRTPGAPVWLIGDLSDGRLVADLLAACGVDRVEH